MLYSGSFIITKAEHETFLKALAIKEGYLDGHGRCDPIIVKTVRFQNGNEIDFKLCNGDTPWCEMVLFDDRGSELTCSEPFSDINTTQELTFGDEVYSIVVLGEDFVIDRKVEA
jgi:hypothetical protein